MKDELPPAMEIDDVAVEALPVPDASLDLLGAGAADRIVWLRPALYLLALALVLTPWASPALALGLGALLALSVGNPWAAFGHKAAKTLLQVCVVLLGFTMNLHTVLEAGMSGAVFAAASIGCTLLLGYWLGRKLGIDAKASALISAGTAICGGSAIAAVATVIDAEEEPMAVAMGTVFILNAVALLLFAPVGHALGLTQQQFGVWAGIAIHDISSVVASAAGYGPHALTTAVAVKLSRALWIIPVSLGFAWWAGRSKSVQHSAKQDTEEAGEPRQARRLRHIPWFIGIFLLASVLRSFVPMMARLDPVISRSSTIGICVTLFLIGGGLSRKAIASVGIRPMIQGVLLWAYIAIGALAVIKLGW